jgi:Tfp pilus assembly protein PilF
MNEHAKRRLSVAYLEMGFIYETFSNKDKAIENYQQALKIYEATGNRLKSAYTLQHIAANYMPNDYNK